MVRMIARAVETGYDSDMPMRADVDPEMHKVGQQTPVPPDGLAPGPSPSSFHPPAAHINLFFISLLTREVSARRILSMACT